MVSETGSIGMGIIEDEVDMTRFTEDVKFGADRASMGATPDGATVFYVEDGNESGAESAVVSIETGSRKPGEDESSWRIAIQVFFPFMVAGAGMVMAGVLLGIVQVRVCSTRLLSPLCHCCLPMSFDINFTIFCVRVCRLVD